MTNEEFDSRRYYKGMHCTLDCEIVGIDFEHRVFTLRFSKRRGTAEVSAAQVTIKDEE